jgi:hypothetical protein
MSEQPAPKIEQPGLEKLKQLLKSRKLWAALIGLGLIVFRAYEPDFPIDDEGLTKIILVLIAYIGGTALEDGLRAKA